MTILTEAQARAIAARYGININTVDLNQYKLVQVIKSLEEKNPELLDLLELHHREHMAQLEAMKPPKEEVKE